MHDRIYSFLGLAAKAGVLTSGDEACERSVKSGKPAMVIVAEDASENTRKKFTDMCKYRDINIKVFGEKDLIGRYIGKEIRSVVAVLDVGFAKRLDELINASRNRDGGELFVKSQDL